MGLAAGFMAGLPAGLVVCAAGRAGAGAAGFAAGGADWPAFDSAVFTLPGVDGLTCAFKPGTAAASKIPIPRYIAARIVRSFLLSVYQPRWPEASLHLQEQLRYQPAW